MHKARLILFMAMLVLFSPFVLAFPSIINDPINFSDYKGKWIVINYWASWCDYCMEEIPQLNAFYRAHRNEVLMLGVNYEDGSVSGLPERIQESGVAFPTFAYDPRRYFPFRLGRISGLPTTLLIAPSGKLQRVLEGPQTRRSLENAIGFN